VGSPYDREREAFFIQHVTGGPVKIGYSVDPAVFLETLNLSTHDCGYRLLATVPGGNSAERDLHVRFRHLRIHGKWFRLDSDLQSHIDQLVSAQMQVETKPAEVRR
jgi:hypothetical protein